MESNTQEKQALLIGMLLVGSGYEKIFADLAALTEKDFVDPGGVIKATDTVLGPMARFEQATFTLSEQLKESYNRGVEELQATVCPSCPACGDAASAPCRDLHARGELVEELKEMMWKSIRKRFPAAPSTIGVREGFVAVGCKSEERSSSSIGIEVIAVGGPGGFSSLMETLGKRFRG